LVTPSYMIFCFGGETSSSKVDPFRIGMIVDNVGCLIMDVGSVLSLKDKVTSVLFCVQIFFHLCPDTICKR